MIGSIFIAGGIKNRNLNDTISVTGSAKQRITSDYVLWDATLTSQHTTPGESARQLTAWTTQAVAFLRKEGVRDSELTIQPVTATQLQNNFGRITGYALTSGFEVRSSRVDQIAVIVRETSRLLSAGVPIQS